MSRAGVTPTPRKVVEQAPRKGRGLSKKTLQRQAEEAADEEKKAKEKEQLEDLQAMRDALPPIGVEWVPRRYTPRASRRSPALLLPRYREAVDDRTLGFYQIDDRSWVAELANLHTFATTSGVYSWTLLRCEVDAREQVTFDCSPCPDNALHGTCVHKLVLESDDPPPFVEMSSQGVPFIAARVLNLTLGQRIETLFFSSTVARHECAKPFSCFWSRSRRTVSSSPFTGTRCRRVNGCVGRTPAIATVRM